MLTSPRGSIEKGDGRRYAIGRTEERLTDEYEWGRRLRANLRACTKR